MIDAAKIGNLLAVCRREKNMTQDELATKLGVTPQAVSKWERGGSMPDIEFFIPISKFLDITVESLLTGELMPQENDGQKTWLPCVDPILFQFGYGLIPYFSQSQDAVMVERVIWKRENNGELTLHFEQAPGDMFERVTIIKRQIALDRGVIVPVIRLTDDPRLKPDEYRISIKGTDMGGGQILHGKYMAIESGEVEDKIDGIRTEEPCHHMPAVWIEKDQFECAMSFGYHVVEPQAIMVSHLNEIIRIHLHELLTRQAVQTLIDNIGKKHPVLVAELEKHLSAGDIKKVLVNLLRDGLSICDLVTILETIADSIPTMTDINLLTENAREALKRPISE